MNPHPEPAPSLKRLLMVTHFFPAHGGGIEVVAGQLARQFLAQNAELRLEWFAGEGDEPPRYTRLRTHAAHSWNGVERKLGIPVPIWSLGALGRLWRAVRRSDMVYLHDFIYPTHILTALFCKMQGKPYVVTQHIGEIPFRGPWLRRLLSAVNERVGGPVLRGAAQVAFVSDEVQRYFRPQLSQSRSKVIPNGVDQTVFFPQSREKRQAIRESLGLKPETPVLLFVGRFVEKKGVLFLAELSKRFPQAQWVFAGQGPLDPEAVLGPSARVLRGLRGAEIAELYNAADLLILPSRGEGFPLVVQEALACGTPVLVEAALAAAAPVAASWMNLEPLGREDDAWHWEARLRELLCQFPESEELRQRRAEFAARQWSWERCAAEYLVGFDEALRR